MALTCIVDENNHFLPTKNVIVNGYSRFCNIHRKAHEDVLADPRRERSFESYSPVIAVPAAAIPIRESAIP